jgi:hypothetical protein
LRQVAQVTASLPHQAEHGIRLERRDDAIGDAFSHDTDAVAGDDPLAARVVAGLAIVGDPDGRPERLIVLDQKAGLRFPEVPQRLGREATEDCASDGVNPTNYWVPDKLPAATIARCTATYNGVHLAPW